MDETFETDWDLPADPYAARTLAASTLIQTLKDLPPDSELVKMGVGILSKLERSMKTPPEATLSKLAGGKS